MIVIDYMRARPDQSTIDVIWKNILKIDPHFKEDLMNILIVGWIILNPDTAVVELEHEFRHLNLNTYLVYDDERVRVIARPREESLQEVIRIRGSYEANLTALDCLVSPTIPDDQLILEIINGMIIFKPREIDDELLFELERRRIIGIHHHEPDYQILGHSRIGTLYGMYLDGLKVSELAVHQVLALTRDGNPLELIEMLPDDP